MSKRRRTVEEIYVTKRARELADATVDKLSNSESMDEHIRVWEQTYLAAGGIVRL